MFISLIFNVEDQIFFKGVTQPSNLHDDTVVRGDKNHLQVPIQPIYFEMEDINIIR